MILYATLAIVLLAVVAALSLPLLREEVLPPARRRLLAGAVAAFVLVAGAGLYVFLGASDLVAGIEAERAEQATLREKLRDLMRHTAEHPEDAEGWHGLGKAWVAARDFPQAVEALRQAVLVSYGHPDIIAEYAAALVMQNNGRVGEDAADSIGIALTLDPRQPLARRLESLRREQQAGETTP